MSIASDYTDHGSSAMGKEDPVTAVPIPAPANAQVGLDKPIYTISVAAEILETHPRTLMMYEHLGLVVPHRTATNRRRYSQRDILTLQAIQRLTRHHGLNLNGARYVIQCLQLMDANKVPRPDFLADIDVTHVRL
jgi:MerR family transcriptional regulator/heat shock protein HspR